MSDLIDDFKERMLHCTKCSLHKTRTNVVFGEGNADHPSLMIVAEAPGQTEDLEGRPFCGKAGDKLDKILEYVKVSRDDIYICNSILCRPPNNRTPLMEEIKQCRFRLMLQIHLIRPHLLVILGKSALQAMLGEPIKGALSQYFDKPELKFFIEGHAYPAVVSYHPAYLLRNPDHSYKQVLPHWTKVKEFIATWPF